MVRSVGSLPFDPETGDALAVIETPKGSRNKYSYNQSLEVFELRKVLPRGMIFPYDFGFFPPRGEPSSYSSSPRCIMNFARSSPFRVLSAIVFQIALASFAEISSSVGRRSKTRS